MNALVHVVAASGALLLGSIAVSGTSDKELTGLVEIASRQVDRAYLLPGADFSAYKKVRITSSEITFRKNWLRKMNRGGPLLAQRITQQDADQILQDARSEFDETWAEAFTTAGYEVVSQAGADVLEIVPSVFDFYVNAPQTGRTRTESLTLKRAIGLPATPPVLGGQVNEDLGVVFPPSSPRTRRGTLRCAILLRASPGCTSMYTRSAE